MAIVIDYSSSRPTISRLKGLGAASNPTVGVMRYVSPSAGSKNLTRSEYAQLSAAGFDVGLVWEGGDTGALGGQAQGARDGARANAQADALGYPATAAIYFAVDFPATSSQLPVVLDYLRAVDAASPRRIGVYGSYAVVEAAAKAGVGSYYWQTSAWSSGRLSPRRNLYQYIYFADVDVNDAVTGDWGQDKPPAPPKPPYPPFPLGASQAFGSDVMSGHGLHLWQARMVARGWTVNTDDVYTAATRGVVTAFQTEKGLVIDGQLGAETWAAAWLLPIS